MPMFRPKPLRKSNRGSIIQRLIQRNSGQPRSTSSSSLALSFSTVLELCALSRWKSLGPRYICILVGWWPLTSKVLLSCAWYSFRSPLPFWQDLDARVAPLLKPSWDISTQLKNWFLKAIQSMLLSVVSSCSPVAERSSMLPSLSLYVSAVYRSSKSKPFSCCAAMSYQLVAMPELGSRNLPMLWAWMVMSTR